MCNLNDAAEEQRNERRLTDGKSPIYPGIQQSFCDGDKGLKIYVDGELVIAEPEFTDLPKWNLTQSYLGLSKEEDGDPVKKYSWKITIDYKKRNN